MDKGTESWMPLGRVIHDRHWVSCNFPTVGLKSLSTSLSMNTSRTLVSHGISGSLMESEELLGNIKPYTV